MKKVLLGIFVCLLAIFVIMSTRLGIIKNDNKNIENEIVKQENINNQVIEDNKKIKNDIEGRKKENKDKWEELEIWQKAKTKLEHALS